MTRALVTGATGAVGPALVRRLLAEGVRVRAVARHEPPPGLFPAEVEFRRIDLAEMSRFGDLVQDVDALTMSPTGASTRLRK